MNKLTEINKVENSVEHQYPLDDFVSTRINSFGKYALDSSRKYIDAISSSDEKVISRLNRHEKLKSLGAPEVILNKEKSMIDDERSNIEKSNDPEVYRSIIETMQNKVDDQGLDKKSHHKAVKAVYRINDIFNAWETSPYIEQILNAKTKTLSGQKNYIEAILAKNEDGEYKLSTEQFRNFLQWHNFEHVKAEKKMNELVPVYKDKFRSLVNDLVSKGELPKNILLNINQIDSVVFVLDDGLLSINDDISGRFSRYDRYDASVATNKVMMSPDSFDDFGVFTHELLHVISGECKDDFGEIQSAINIWAMAKSNELGDEDYLLGDLLDDATRVIEESVCETIAAQISEMSEEYMSYRGERIVLDGLIKNSYGRLSLDGFKKILFENDSNKINDFMNRINDSYESISGNILLELGKVEKWDCASLNEASKARLLRAIFNDSSFNLFFNKDIPESRFSGPEAFVEYLETIKKSRRKKKA